MTTRYHHKVLCVIIIIAGIHLLFNKSIVLDEIKDAAALNGSSQDDHRSEVVSVDKIKSIDQSTSLSSVKEGEGTKEGKHVTQSQIQISHRGVKNRYIEEYTTIKEHLENLGDDSTNSEKRLLSFGCSVGNEAITLATNYTDPKYSIFGVDIDEETLEEAATNIANEVVPTYGKDKVTLFNGQNTKISEYGPYDAIFANSVFCIHPPPKGGAKEILERFSFSDFDASISYLDESLKVGGILGIVNTNYIFSDASVYNKYKPVSVQCPNFVPKVSYKKGTFYDEEEGAVFQGENIWLRACVWVKVSA